MSILITGAAGYIGSHCARYFSEKGKDVIALDSLETGFRESLSKDIKFYNTDIRQTESLKKIFAENNIDGVIHFAANSLVAESVKDPFKYYYNNVYSMMMLLNAMKDYDVKKIVFSSSAAVYGEPENVPITENDAKLPTNPYGQTKLAMEDMMKWFDKAYGIRFVSLRYFNAAGAHPSGEIGEAHNPETHLIPLILQVPLKKREKVYIYGDDYNTRDGSCIRDYIHVMDLVKAHLLAFEYLGEKNAASDIFNLGSGEGFSVKEVIETAREMTGENIPSEASQRRAGDPAVLIASSQRAEQILGWEKEYDDLKTIITDAWRWHKNHPNGYKNA